MSITLRPTRSWIALTTLTLFTAYSHAHAVPTYSLTEIGTVTSDPNSHSYASRINDRGQILGANWSPHTLTKFIWQAGVTRELNLTENGNTFFLSALNSAGVGLGFAQSNDQAGPALWRDGHVVYLPAPGGPTDYRLATDINDLGDAVGFAYQGYLSEICYGLLWRNGTAIDLSNLGGKITLPIDINNRSQVVGTATTADGTEHGFLWDNGTITDISHPNAAAIQIGGINDLGQVAGTWRDSSGTENAFLWQDGHMIDLPLLPGDVWSGAYGINELGQIVGISGKDYASHLVVWDNQRITDLTSLIDGGSGWIFEPSGINSDGWIIGTAHAAGHDYGFLLRPVPEPHSIVAVCLTMLLLLSRRPRSHQPPIVNPTTRLAKNSCQFHRLLAVSSGDVVNPTYGRHIPAHRT